MEEASAVNDGSSILCAEGESALVERVGIPVGER